MLHRFWLPLFGCFLTCGATAGIVAAVVVEEGVAFSLAAPWLVALDFSALRPAEP